MASIIVKWQKCGKEGCRCREGMPHGPYFWLVRYVTVKSSDKRRGKYTWKYLGKKPADAWQKLSQFNQRFQNTFDLQDFDRKVAELNVRRKLGAIHKTTEKLLSVDDQEIKN
ncbi:MAG: DUF6788 family protein [Candidatus Hodarchaeales archaeon]|jgi:hypothetical protein